MPRWSLVVLLLVMGCEHAAQPPIVPPPPEDLSTWSVPELVQPPAPPTPAPAEEKATAGEKVYAFTPGSTSSARNSSRPGRSASVSVFAPRKRPSRNFFR